MSSDEEVVSQGVVTTGSEGGGSGIKAKAFSLKRNLCSNCKKGIHNTPEIDSRCTDKSCECKCKTHFLAPNGRPYPYGTPADKIREDPFDFDTGKPTQQYLDALKQVRQFYHSLSKPEKKQSEDSKN